jgi:hypothetical protein
LASQSVAVTVTRAAQLQLVRRSRLRPRRARPMSAQHHRRINPQSAQRCPAARAWSLAVPSTTARRHGGR